MNSRFQASSAILLLFAVLCGIDSKAARADTESTLPVVHYSGGPVTDPFFEQIQHTPQFQKLSREAVGSPIELRASHTYRIHTGGATATGLLAAATLGLIPQVLSGEHCIVYEILVNDVPLSSYRYCKAFTRAHNLWSRELTQGLGADGVKWAGSTVDLFIKDAANDPKLSALIAEFEYYFAPSKSP